MGNNLGVGIRAELRAFLLQLLAQFAEILDDAVVDDCEPVGGVGMRVAFGRPAVGRPAGMSDSGMPVERLGLQPLLEVFQFAFGAAARQTVAFQRGDACGIIAAIFQAFERIHQLLRDRSASENADNAAHAVQFPQIDE
jgi:hypothetical protein